MALGAVFSLICALLLMGVVSRELVNGTMGGWELENGLVRVRKSDFMFEDLTAVHDEIKMDPLIWLVVMDIFISVLEISLYRNTIVSSTSSRGHLKVHKTNKFESKKDSAVSIR